ncbi:MAG: hypothetical protein U5K71_15775 [Gracilimonas sp.]|nr:hypothetical protein [Gracilimonas sp.]
MDIRAEPDEGNGALICVIFEIKCSGIDIRLPLGQCPKGNGGGRQPNKKERQLIDEFEKIKDKEINPGLNYSILATS